jgi:hypothetical protein
VRGIGCHHLWGGGPALRTPVVYFSSIGDMVVELDLWTTALKRGNGHRANSVI